MMRSPVEEGRLPVEVVLPDLRLGGAQRAALELMRVIDRRRFEIRLVLLEATGELLQEVPDDVPVVSCGKRAGLGIRWISRLRGHARTSTRSIFVSYLWFANAALLVSMLGRRHRPVIVLTEHSVLDRSIEPLVHRTAREICTRLLFPRADLIIAPGPALAEQLRRRLGRRRAPRVEVIPNPIPSRAESAPSAEIRRTATRWRIGAVGRLVHVKGFDLAIRALARASSPSQLVIAGDGPERVRLECLASELGVADRVVFLGFVKDPFGAIEPCDLLVVPSRREGFGNVLVEAMARGLPVIAARCPVGPPELVTDGVDGVLVDPDSPSALARAIDDLLRSPEIRERLGREGRRRSRDFASERIVARIEEELRALGSSRLPSGEPAGSSRPA